MRHVRFLEETRDLNALDRGLLSEEFYRLEHAPEATRHVRVRAADHNAGLPSDTDAWMRSDRVPDLVKGASLEEVKSHRGPLSRRDVEQVEDYLRALGEEGSFDLEVGGDVRGIHRVVVVFMSPDGGRANLSQILDWLDQHARLRVELFDDSGAGRVFDQSDAHEIGSFLGVG